MITKKLLLLILFPLSMLLGQSRLDSVLSKIANLPDTARIRQLNDLCFKYRVADERFAIACGEKSLEIAKSSGNKVLEAKTLNILGVVYRVFTNYEKALECFVKALRVAEEVNDSTEIGYSENNMAHTYRIKNYYTLALDHANSSLIMFKAINNKVGIGYATKCLGEIYYQQKNYYRALDYFEQSFTLRKEIGDFSGKIFSLISIGDVYSQQKNYEIAIEKYSEAETALISSKERTGLMTIWSGLGNIYLNKQEYAKSLDYFTKQLNLASETGSISASINANKYLGIVYAKMNRFPEGEQRLLLALEQAKKSKDDYLLNSCYFALSNYYELKKDFQNALSYAKIVISLKDTINLRENISGVSEMETIYQNDKRWKETVLLEKDVQFAQTQRNYLIIIIILLILSSSVLAWRFNYKRKANAKLHELNATKDKFFSIIAHDLKNPFHGLMSVSSAVLEDIADKNYEDVENYVKIMHESSKRGYQLLVNLLDWSLLQRDNMNLEFKPCNLLSITKEVIQLIQPIALDKQIKIKLNIDDSKVCYADENSLNTILRNIIGNAVKYTRDFGEITISASNRDSMVELSVQDDGVGIKSENLGKLFNIDSNYSMPGTREERGTGLGLILCKDFLKKMGGDIWVESTFGRGTTFTLSIPILKMK